ncbi:MAG: lipid-binding SYLF domain-containing protein [Geminicoccaceae bacterium]
MVKSATRLIAVLAFVMIGLAGQPAQAQLSEQQQLVERSRLVLDAFLSDPQFESVRVYVQNAYAVLIMPQVLKGGFLLGATYGNGVLLARDPQSGAWGEPAFYDMGGGSIGLQIGLQSSDMIFTIMNEGALSKLLAHGVKFGADAGVAAGPLGVEVGAATTTHFGEDIYAWGRSQGLFGGFWLDGTMLLPKNDWNQAYYGRPIQPEEIVRQRRVVASAEVAALHDALMRF